MRPEPKLHKPAFMYLPACLMSHTGGLSTSIPRTALSKSGSAAAVAFGSTAVPEYDFSEFRSETQLTRMPCEGHK